MVWFCYKHNIHSIDDECPMCSREPDWKAMALFLLDCHAATCEHEAMLWRTSKSSRKRFLAIMETALGLLDGKEPSAKMRRPRLAEVSRARGNQAAAKLREKIEGK